MKKTYEIEVIQNGTRRTTTVEGYVPNSIEQQRQVSASLPKPEITIDSVFGDRVDQERVYRKSDLSQPYHPDVPGMKCALGKVLGTDTDWLKPQGSPVIAELIRKRFAYTTDKREVYRALQ